MKDIDSILKHIRNERKRKAAHMKDIYNTLKYITQLSSGLAFQRYNRSVAVVTGEMVSEKDDLKFQINDKDVKELEFIIKCVINDSYITCMSVMIKKDLLRKMKNSKMVDIIESFNLVLRDNRTLEVLEKDIGDLILSKI